MLVCEKGAVWQVSGYHEQCDVCVVDKDEGGKVENWKRNKREKNLPELDNTIAITPHIIRPSAINVRHPISSPSKHFAKNKFETRLMEPIGVFTDCGVNVKPTKSPKLPRRNTVKPRTHVLFVYTGGAFNPVFLF